MDNWTSSQVICMLEGGNGQLKGFFARQKVSIDTSASAYKSKAAKYYKKQLISHLDTIIETGVSSYQGRAKRSERVVAETNKKKRKEEEEEDEEEEEEEEKKMPPTSDSNSNDKVENKIDDLKVDEVEDEDEDENDSKTTKKISEMSLADFKPDATPKKSKNNKVNSSNSPNSPPASLPPSPPLHPAPPTYTGSSDPSREYSFTFNAGSMELSLEKRVDGAAIVSKTTIGGVAHLNGVTVGSAVIGLDGKLLNNFDKILGELSSGKRPVTVMFRKPFAGIGGGGGGGGGGGSRNRHKNNGRGGGIGYSQMEGIGSGSSAPPVESNSIKSSSEITPNINFTTTTTTTTTTTANNEPPTATTAQSRIILATSINNNPQYHTVDFAPKESLGMRLEQFQSPKTGKEQSQVTFLNPGGNAEKAGVKVGDVIFGVNYSSYISHSHVVATVINRGDVALNVKFIR